MEKFRLQKQVSNIEILAQAVTDDRICDYVRTRRAAKNWIEDVLDIKGKLDEDLHVSLRSGVILCYLMLAIEEGSIPRIQENTEHQFKQKENVGFFIDAAAEYGVPKHKLFSVNDLWENASMVNVIECLAALAEVSASKGFPVTLKKLPKEGENSNAAILKAIDMDDKGNYKSQLARVKTARENVKRPKISEAIVRKKLALLAGNGVDATTLEKGFARFQAVYRSYVARKLYQKRVRDQAYRDNVAKEILSTEQTYVQNLGTCIKCYYNPLKEAIANKKPIIDDTQLKTIFSDIVLIHSLNEQLLKELKPIVENWSPNKCLGQIFIKIMDFLKIYSGYIQNFNASLDCIHQCSKKEKFEKFLLQAKEQTENKMDLPSFLIMPVQRIPRYNLLLKDLLKRTWSDHPDYEALTQASQKADKIAEYLNEMKRLAEEQTVLMELQSKITGKAVPRLAIIDRKMYRSTTFEDSKQGEVTLFLFNDMIMCCKPDKKQYKFKETFQTKELEIRPPSVADSANKSFSVYFVNTKKALFEITAKTSEEKEAWVSDFNKAKQALEKSKSNGQSSNKTNQPEQEAPDIRSAEQTLRERRTAKSFHQDSLNSKSPDTSPSTSAPSSPQVTPKAEDNNNNTQQYIESLIAKREGLLTQLKEAEEMAKKKKNTGQQKEFATNMASQLQQEIEDITKELKELKVENPEPSPDWKKTSKDRQTKSRSLKDSIKAFSLRRKSHVVEATISDDSDEEPPVREIPKDQKRATH
eukprot:CAMPEP_0168571736 /NCGR_PEP_ID=MMETSP0413-20121227/17521_1 /TAXON_ID=136452 /ORGANISM="Filamoeba nolandi, Strain NC-AS-23-1" /LENGTH=753 /DNA_ID=CAMNT_0008604661 /DNA_START=30 /DNA_END=2291 /DNA_ORIENTATION=+